MAKPSHSVNKSDISRVLVTETIPFETPIIFSNEGFYRHVAHDIGASNQVSRFLVEKLVKARKSSTIPFAYKIRKNTLEFRKLSLPHPSAQWDAVGFYETYKEVILHYCSGSPASIRAPFRIAGTFYTKSSWENIHRYRNGSVTEAWVDGYSKHSPSYFAYRGYDRLYKFFDSKLFMKLEKRFSTLSTLDVSKCFDSIYTHSLSWALKDKAFTKSHVKIDSTFAQQFDVLMQKMNHKETNGIPIGPEMSRIFSELLFQEVDLQTIKKARNAHDLKFDVHYAFYRYVDDVFFFTNDEEVASVLYELYSEALTRFNLHANKSKALRLKRPFITKKSRITREASLLANQFLDKFLEEQREKQSLSPKKIHSKWKLTHSFIEQVKTLCSYNDVDYDDISSYLISVFTERVKKLANLPSDLQAEDAPAYRDACLVLLEVLFFLYSVSPSVSASYKLSTAVIVVARFGAEFLADCAATLNQRIYELSEEMLIDNAGRGASSLDQLLPLECINILLAIRELGEHYLLPPEVIERLLIKDGEGSYFDIVSCLFYIGNDPIYASVKRKVLRKVNKRLASLADIDANAEKAHLLLDLLACPYVHDGEKKRWLYRLYQKFGATLPSPSDVADFLRNDDKWYWFVNWEEVDLLNSLEKKELKRAY